MNGSVDKAESYFQKSLLVNDNDRFALYYLSNIYRDLEKYDESIVVAEKHIALYPKEREGYINK